MAPNLKPVKRILIRDIIKDKGFINKEIIEAAFYINRTVKAINRNLRLFDNIIIPLNRSGRPRFITSIIFDSLFKHLNLKPDLYLVPSGLI
jgi:predicted transcriptional regulator